jgi:hypothetical protein
MIIFNYIIVITMALSVYSCDKEELEPVDNNIIPIEYCLDTCGTIIACKYYMNDYPEITSVLTVTTSCDTLDVVKIHTIEEIQYFSGMEVCFER